MASFKAPKKVNLLDHNSIKHIIDESVSEIVKSSGYVENVRLSNVKMLIGTIIIVIALFSQFYKKKFPENRDFLIVCIILYPLLKFWSIWGFIFCKFGLIAVEEIMIFEELIKFILIIHTKEKNAILITYPPAGSFTTTGLVVSSKLPRFSDLYTLTIESADPKSVSANEPVHLTKSVTEWFTKDGILVEGLIWKDVEALINQYTKEPKKNK
ncbi:hypothetical protein Lal_00038590 [Lupinus albus]|nr:hypothetical protein Lal_00038590 [Lupinus albus]